MAEVPWASTKTPKTAPQTVHTWCPLARVYPLLYGPIDELNVDKNFSMIDQWLNYCWHQVATSHSWSLVTYFNISVSSCQVLFSKWRAGQKPCKQTQTHIGTWMKTNKHPRLLSSCVLDSVLTVHKSNEWSSLGDAWRHGAHLNEAVVIWCF